MTDLVRELAEVLNRHSVENRSGTPDFILAGFLSDCLDAWAMTTRERDTWWRFEPKIGGTIPAVDQ